VGGDTASTGSAAERRGTWYKCATTMIYLLTKYAVFSVKEMFYLINNDSNDSRPKALRILNIILHAELYFMYKQLV
jgi:hypothetical protein